MIRLVLPYPPTANNAKVPVSFVRGGKRVHRLVPSTESKRYTQRVVDRLAGAPRITEGRIAVAMQVYPPDRRRRDLINAEKVIIDAVVKAGVIPDDSAIDHWELDRCPPVEGGRIIIEIERMDVNDVALAGLDADELDALTTWEELV